MVEGISEEINGLVKHINSNTEKEIMKELFTGLESVGCCVYIEQHSKCTGLNKVLVVKNVRANPIETYKAAIGLKVEKAKNNRELIKWQ